MLGSPIFLEGHELALSASIGIGIFPGDAGTATELMKCADTAMFKAKEQGGNTYQFYKPEMNAHSHELFLLESALRKALEGEQLVLKYQPQVNMETGEVFGAEALLRWRHPEKGEIAPADFIPLAEETGLIVPIGAWVLRTACRQNKAWQEAGFPPLRIAVNISGRQFKQPDFIDLVDWTLTETGLDPRWLELEITESVVMGQVETAITTLAELKKRGISLSIDDFGTGYSSLNYLKRFPLSSLKIDRSFIQDVPEDTHDAAITSSIIALARSMGLEVIAEGVETEKQARFLRKRGCLKAQGYLFSPPLAEAEVKGFFGTCTKSPWVSPGAEHLLSERANLP